MFRIYSFSFLIELIAAIFWSCWAAALIERGFALNELAYSLAALFLSQALFEVPTGLVADRVGRKRCTIAGLTIAAAGYVVVAFAKTVSDLLPGFFLAGLGLTFVSGARMAWLYARAGLISPEIKSDPKKHDEFFLNLNVAGRLAVITGAFGGVFLLQKIGSGMWIAVSLLALFAAWCATLVGPDPFVRSTDPMRFREIGVGLASPVLLLTVVSIFFFGAETGNRNLVNQPYILQITNNNSSYLAYLQATLAVARLGGMFFYRALSRKRKSVSKQFALVVPLLIFALAQAIATQAQSFPVFITFYAAAIFAMGWYFPMRDAFINSIVPEKLRATLLSFDNMVMDLGSCAALIFVAGHVNARSVAWLWWIGVGCLLASALWLSLAVSANGRRGAHG